MKFSNKEKGVYLLWVTINLILYISSGNFGFGGTNHNTAGSWYPIYTGFFLEPFRTFTKIEFNPSYAYDLSEFILYSTVPILLFAAYKLLTTKKD